MERSVIRGRPCQLHGLPRITLRSIRATRWLRVLRLKIHRNAVDAVPQMSGRRTVVEQMAEMTAAPAAVDFGAGHAVAPVGRGFDRALHGIVEAWPAGAAIEFLLRHE